MRKRQSIKSIVLSLILCITMLPLAGIQVFAADASLLTLAVGGDAITLTGADSYDVTVPVRYVDGVDNFVLPAVKATSAEGNTVSVSEPAVDKANAKATVNVTVSNGTEEATYTINMALIGMNMYENGGFEAGENTAFGESGKPLARVAGAGYNGDYGLHYRMSYTPVNYGFYPIPTLKAGKSYIASNMIRLAEDTDGTPSALRFNVATTTADATLDVSFYKSGAFISDYYTTGAGSKNNTSSPLTNNIALGQAWENVTTVIIPSNDAVVNPKIFNYGQTVDVQGYVNTDDYFMGELVMADFKVAMAGNEIGKFIETKNDINSAVTAAVTNQLGNTYGIEKVYVGATGSDRTTTTFELVSAPEGVTFANGTLNIPAGTTGFVSFKATAVPTAAWVNAPQESFAKEFTYELVEDLDKVNTLATLKVGEETIAVNDGVYTYSVTAPAYYENGVDNANIVLPAIVATAKNDFETVVNNAVINGSTATVAIDVKNGEEILETYTVNIDLIGMNMYENGGFETGTNTTFGAPTSFPNSVSVKANAAYTGSYGLERLISFHSGTYYQPAPTLEKDTTYLTSVMAKGTADMKAIRFRVLDENILASNSTILTDSRNAEQTLVVDIYKDGVEESYWGYTTSPAASVMSTNGTLGTEWKNFAAIITPAVTTPVRVELFSSGDHIVSYTDDYFMGELVMAGFNVKLGDEALADVVSVKSGISKNLTAAVTNQIGTTVDMASRATTTVELVDAPAGVTLEGGILNIVEGTTGNVTIKATATPKASWANAPQKSFSKSYTFTLVDDVNKADPLESLKVGEDVIELVTGVREFDVAVPVYYENGVDNYTYELPEIVATAKDAEYNVAVSTADEADGKVVATITVKDGDATVGTYTINMNLIGKNMYANGGFENSATTPFETNATVAVSRVAGMGYYGNTAAKFLVNAATNTVKYTPAPTFKAGKEYLFTHKMKPTNGVGMTVGNLPFTVKAANADTDLDASFYVNGAHINDYYTKQNLAQSVRLHQATFTGGWNNFSVIVIPSADDAIDYYMQNYDNNNIPQVYADDYFAGELVMAGFDVKLGGEAIAELVSVKDGFSKNLTAAVTNQLGETVDMAQMKKIANSATVTSNRTTTTVELVSAPNGVTFENGVLTVPAGTTGDVTIKAIAVPTAAWTTTSQKSFAKKITFELVEDADKLNPLTSIEFGANAIALVDGVREYEITAPVYYENGVEKFDIPEITAKATNADFTVDIDVTEPEVEIVESTVTLYKEVPKTVDGYATGEGSATATITVKDGEEVIDTYEITINLVGINMFLNGGFESGENERIGQYVAYDGGNWFHTDTGAERYARSGLAAAEGDYGLLSTINTTGGKYYQPTPALSANKTYYASLMMRVSDAVSDADLTTPPKGSTNFQLRIGDASNINANDDIDSAGLAGAFYEDGVRMNDSYYNNYKKHLSAQNFSSFDREWSHYGARFTADKDFDFYIMPIDWKANVYPVYTDNYFVGEMVLGGIKLLADGVEAPAALTTTNAISTRISGVATNQIGDTCDIDAKTTTSVALESAPAGVTFEGGVLNVPAGTTGEVVFKATSVVDTTAWDNAPVNKFAEYITIVLLANDGLTAVKEGNVVTTTLSYVADAAEDVLLYHAVYAKDAETNTMVINKVYTENVSLTAGQMLGRIKEITLSENEVLKSFFWNKNSIKPIFANTVSE